MTDTPDPLDAHVAEAMYDSMAEEGEPAFADAPEAVRENLLDLAMVAATAHVDWLQSNGTLIIPQGSLPLPRSVEEAGAMAQIASSYLKAAKRKKSLLTSGPRLIVPGRGH